MVMEDCSIPICYRTNCNHPAVLDYSKHYITASAVEDNQLNGDRRWWQQ